MATPEKIAATTVAVAVPRIAIASAPIQNAAAGRSAIGVSDMKTITGLHATSAAPASAVPVSKSRRPSWKVKNTSIAAADRHHEERPAHAGDTRQRHQQREAGGIGRHHRAAGADAIAERHQRVLGVGPRQVRGKSDVDPRRAARPQRRLADVAGLIGSRHGVAAVAHAQEQHGHRHRTRKSRRHAVDDRTRSHAATRRAARRRPGATPIPPGPRRGGRCGARCATKCGGPRARDGNRR